MIAYLSELVKLTATAVKKLLHVLTVDRLELVIRAAGEDAADTALLFGKICAGVYPSLSALQCVIRTRNGRWRLRRILPAAGRRCAFMFGCTPYPCGF